jgi:hypothetical protein
MIHVLKLPIGFDIFIIDILKLSIGLNKFMIDILKLPICLDVFIIDILKPPVGLIYSWLIFSNFPLVQYIHDRYSQTSQFFHGEGGPC